MSIKVKLYKEVSHNSYRTKIEFFTTAKIKGKRILVDSDNLTDTQQDFYKYPIEFNYRVLDSKKEVYSEKVNVELISKMDFYCKLNLLQRMKLKSIFSHLWIQQPENIKWIVMAIFAGIGSFLALIKFVLDCN